MQLDASSGPRHTADAGAATSTADERGKSTYS
jgi:hypothetical protein